MEQLLVSIIIPVFNAERHLKSAILSLTEGTYKNIEIICVNDGSTDHSLEILTSLAARDPRIKIVNQKNMGVAVASNRAIDLAQGHFIARMDADDVAHPNRIAAEVEAATAQQADVVASSISFFGDRQGAWIISRDHDEIFVDALLGSPVPQPTVLCRREVLAKNRYSQDIRFAEDYELWTRLLCRGYRFFGIQEPLLDYRFHKTQISTQQGGDQARFAQNIRARFRAELGFREGVADESILKTFFNIKTFLLNLHTISQRGIRITKSSAGIVARATLPSPQPRHHRAWRIGTTLGTLGFLVLQGSLNRSPPQIRAQ